MTSKEAQTCSSIIDVIGWVRVEKRKRTRALFFPGRCNRSPSTFVSLHCAAVEPSIIFAFSYIDVQLLAFFFAFKDVAMVMTISAINSS